MSEDLEHLLRTELAGRAESAPPLHGEGLADAAIAGAGRIRRRRRLGAAAGGLGLVVFGAAVAIWLPGAGGLEQAPPVATTVEEAQSELDIEFVVEREGAYGVVNADDEYIPLHAEQAPQRAERLQDTYVVSSPMWVEVTDLDGAESVGYEVPSDDFHTVVRSDAESFAVNYPAGDSGRQLYQLFPADASPSTDPLSLDLTTEITLQDWSDSLLVFSGDLTGVTGGASGTYYFNDQYDWGLDTVAAAGYESAVITDYNNPDYVCVADLQPGGSAAESEECGYLSEYATETMIADASADSAAPGLVTHVSTTYYSEGLETEIEGDDSLQQQLFDSEHQFVDPLGRWQIAFSSEDETWALLDMESEPAAVSELPPPEGALMPVVSYN
ncbi:hypothetical protein [Glycomyces arizonensis]|uniref:hypothetical protein n=1 Tax=Glycomyces arizonensis TaxID=256035 RepID=UPI000405432A|nr:hypothetical protein [Glycomyces arizonensis]